MNKIISCFVLIGLASSFMLIDSSLNQGRILWPTETWVSSPIQLSQTNGGSTVKLTFTFRPSTLLTNGVLQVIFPSGVSGGPLYISSSFSGDKDISLTYTGITLSTTAGIYGPFILITRTSQTGQMYDVNNVFGYIAITSPISIISDLTVTNAAANPVLGSSDTLFFAFNLNQNLWKYDLIEIVPSPSYTPSPSVTCSSITVTGVTNILYGPAGDHNLPCAIAAQSISTTGPQFTASDSNSVYIYGLSQDILLASGTIAIKLSISTFNHPLYSQLASSNTWKVNIWRWGTSNLLATYGPSGGPTTPTVGTVTAVSWLPINSALAAVDVVAGMTIFTKVTFTTQHDIPAGGKAQIVFSNVDISSNWWADLDGTSSASGSQCYLTIPIADASCTIDSASSVKISFTNQQPAGSISIALLTAFSLGAKISYIVTSSQSWNIDYAWYPAVWPLSVNNLLYSYFKFHGYFSASSNTYPLLANSGSYSTGFNYGADTSFDLYWAFKPNLGVAWTTATAIWISLPFTTSGISFTKPYIFGSATQYEMDNGLASNDVIAFTTPPTKGSFYYSENGISVTFQSAASAGYYVMAIGNGKAALPYVASNLGTFYECFATSWTNLEKEIGSSVYSVLIRDYVGVDIYARPFCNANNAAGIPLVSAFVAKLMAIDFNSVIQNYVLEITITDGADLGTGLTKGSNLPLSSTSPGVTAILDQVVGNTIIKLTGFGAVTPATSAITTFLAMGQLPGNTFNSRSRLYYTTSSDSSVKNCLYFRFFKFRYKLSSSRHRSIINLYWNWPSYWIYTIFMRIINYNWIFYAWSSLFSFQ